MTMTYLATMIAGPVFSMMVGASLTFVAYLGYLELVDFRRHRRMDAERERLGLTR